MNITEIKLPSGATLKIQPSPFAVAKALYQALLRELQTLSISFKTVDMQDLMKDIFCIGFSSPDIEAHVWQCFGRCMIDGLKIDADTFEPIERRDDYMKVCVEVTKANVFPFVKSLFAEFQSAMAMAEESQALRQKTT